MSEMSQQKKQMKYCSNKQNVLTECSSCLCLETISRGNDEILSNKRSKETDEYLKSGQLTSFHKRKLAS